MPFLNDAVMLFAILLIFAKRLPIGTNSLHYLAVCQACISETPLLLEQVVV